MLGIVNDPIVAVPLIGRAVTETFGRKNSPWWRATSVIGTV
jgi:hypothetical protein